MRSSAAKDDHLRIEQVEDAHEPDAEGSSRFAQDAACLGIPFRGCGRDQPRIDAVWVASREPREGAGSVAVASRNAAHVLGAAAANGSA